MTNRSYLSTFLSAACVALALCAVGCDDDGGLPAISDRGVGGFDYFFPPPGDIYTGGTNDFFSGSRDSGVLDGQVDQGADAGGCAPPSGAKCSAACGPKQICTEVEGGRCGDVVELVGKPDNKAVLVAMATAFHTCWKKDPSEDTLCATFDACALSAALDEPTFKDWICKMAQISDFPSKEIYDGARSVNACGTLQLVYRPVWKTSTIAGGETGKICLSYDKNPIWSFDRLRLEPCKDWKKD